MPENTQSPVLLEWQSPDTLPKQRSRRWYVIGGVFILMFAAYGLFDGSWTTALLALLIGGMYFLLRNEKPQQRAVRITGVGVSIGNDFYQWNQLHDFWILVGADYSELHFFRTGTLSREFVVYVQGVDPAMVRNTLIQFLPERAGMEERFLDSVAHILKL